MNTVISSSQYLQNRDPQRSPAASRRNFKCASNQRDQLSVTPNNNQIKLSNSFNNLAVNSSNGTLGSNHSPISPSLHRKRKDVNEKQSGLTNTVSSRDFRYLQKDKTFEEVKNFVCKKSEKEIKADIKKRAIQEFSNHLKGFSEFFVVEVETSMAYLPFEISSKMSVRHRSQSSNSSNTKNSTNNDRRLTLTSVNSETSDSIIIEENRDSQISQKQAEPHQPTNKNVRYFHIYETSDQFEPLNKPFFVAKYCPIINKNILENFPHQKLSNIEIYETKNHQKIIHFERYKNFLKKNCYYVTTRAVSEGLDFEDFSSASSKKTKSYKIKSKSLRKTEDKNSGDKDPDNPSKSTSHAVYLGHISQKITNKTKNFYNSNKNLVSHFLKLKDENDKTNFVVKSMDEKLFGIYEVENEVDKIGRISSERGGYGVKFEEGMGRCGGMG